MLTPINKPVTVFLRIENIVVGDQYINECERCVSPVTWLN
jgi:hypothetical protein